MSGVDHPDPVDARLEVVAQPGPDLLGLLGFVEHLDDEVRHDVPGQCRGDVAIGGPAVERHEGQIGMEFGILDLAPVEPGLSRHVAELVRHVTWNSSR